MTTLANDIIDFWYAGSNQDLNLLAARNAVWFHGGSDFDAKIRRRFAPAIEAALRGELDDWQESPLTRCALILVLDQFTRNVYRGSAEAFAGDTRALALCRKGIELGHDRELNLAERRFFYLPLEHAEDLAVQDQSVACFEALVGAAPPALREEFVSNVGYANHHRDIVREFGRFPHRNEILGRTSSEAEIAYLRDGGARFGQ